MGKLLGFPNFYGDGMKVYYPSYYHDFQCIAAACPDSCCKEWAVDIDPAAASAYRKLDGPLGDCLRDVLVDSEWGTSMKITDGRCPMWQADGLCRIQAELGHDALCKTCREYPRIRHDYGDFAELGLELSCPEAAQIILHSPQRLQMETTSEEGLPEYDCDVMKILKTSRQTALDFLEYDAYTVPEKLAILLLYAHDVQAEIDGDSQVTFCPDILLTESQKYATHGDIACIFDFFGQLELLTERWDVLLKRKPQSLCWDNVFTALASYFIQRYWLQTVSDLDLICRVKFMISACLLICALGGDAVQTAQLFSKEIENDLDNVNAILDGAYTSPALTDANLLGLLLGKT